MKAKRQASKQMMMDGTWAKMPQVPQWVIDEWIGQVESRDDDKPRTNYEMYTEIRDIHQTGEVLDYDLIEEIFNLEQRAEIDLVNLRDFILAVTLMGGQDVLKAKINSEQAEVQRHQKRVELMNLLNEAIESAL